jgi:energy-coupling factor transport system substrate-specific component
MARRMLGGSIYALSAAIGILAFLYPFLLPSVSATPMGMGHSQDAPIITVVLVGLALVGLVIELQGQALGAKTVAMLGVLVAIASTLRFLDVVMPLPGGFSPIFAPIILTGYAFGARLGFLMGIFTLLASALITGGVGPWLPYQMFTAGWVGMSAGWLGQLRLPERGRLRPFLLAAFGFVWGLLFGAIMNLFFWPFAVGPAQQTWHPGIGLAETLARYGVFYLATSLGWDLGRAVGNALLLLALSEPVLRALLRFRRRFHFEVGAGV